MAGSGGMGGNAIRGRMRGPRPRSKDVRLKLTRKGMRRVNGLLLPEEDAPAALWGAVLQGLRGRPDFKFAYKYYLKSVAWSDKRVEVFEEKGLTCVADYSCCDVIANTVHHVTYKNVGNEPLKDLDPVCEPCHYRIHHLD